VIDLRNAQWRTSSRSTGQGQCVEVARNLKGVVAVRDSKDPQGPTIVVDRTAWRRFITDLVS
jgi:hypothetical protein